MRPLDQQKSTMTSIETGSERFLMELEKEFPKKNVESRFVELIKNKTFMGFVFVVDITLWVLLIKYLIGA